MNATASNTPAVTPLSRAMDTIRNLRAQVDSLQARGPVAVVGVGLRLPGNIKTLDQYWDAVVTGQDLVRPIPPVRRAPFDQEWDTVPHSGGFLDDVLGFDASFFGVNPKEARALDPQHRLLLEVAWEAMEDAALQPGTAAVGSAGLYVGVTWQDYRDWPNADSGAYWTTGNGHSFAVGRMAYTLGMTGPAIAVDTACSSSLVSVHLAVQALRRGECEVAIAGGVNLILSPKSSRIVAHTRSLSPDGLCRAFDAQANGFVRGEGCGLVVLKRLDAALRDGDRIHAVIHGSAVNQDGRSTALTAPNVLSQSSLITTALADAKLTAADIGLVEAHGTGTPLGDPIEMEALLSAVARPAGGQPMFVGSVKANIGHLEAAAGIAGLLKTILCLRRRVVPPLAHLRQLNPRIDLEGHPVMLPTEARDWPAVGQGQYAGVSSFGMSGTNAHVVLGAAEGQGEAVDTPVTGFRISARTPAALRELAARLHTWLAEAPDADYPAFAYTTTYGRAPLDVCATIAAPDRATALKALRAVADDEAAAATWRQDDLDLPQLPRRVLSLPHYPWQRTRFASTP